jgi:hypothetical protein
VDVVAVECGQFIKVAACGSFGLHGRLIERQSYGPISRSVLTLSPSPAASKVTAIPWTAVAQRRPHLESPVNIDRA